MRYDNIVAGRFIERPNRFIAKVEIAGVEETVHVKNTGRCKELLVPGATVYLQHFPGGARKTKYDLIAVKKGELLTNMDSQAPNKVVKEWLLEQEPFGKITFLKPEYTYGKSRFDFYLEMGERKMFIEVKGVTLEDDGVVLFPDAPTERGLKHVEELINCVEKGYEAVVLFVVQMAKAKYFTPNRKTQPDFADALVKASAAGVKVLAYTCSVSDDSLAIDKPLKVRS